MASKVTPAKAGAASPKAIWVTPEMAQHWLSENKNNRNLNPHRVARYAEDMKSDSWQVTGDALRFSKSGRLLDGQHRLLACIKAQTAFQSVVFTGLSEESQLLMDQGMVRTQGSQLTILGYERGRDLASACTAYWRMDGGRRRMLTRALSPSNSEIYELLEGVLEIEECLGIYFSHKSQSGVRCHSGASIAMYVYMRDFDPDKADSFIKEYLTGVNLKEGSPALALRERVLKYKYKGHKVLHADFITWMAYAWKAHVAGKSLKRITCMKRLPVFPGSPNWDAMEADAKFSE